MVRAHRTTQQSLNRYYASASASQSKAKAEAQPATQTPAADAMDRIEDEKLAQYSFHDLHDYIDMRLNKQNTFASSLKFQAMTAKISTLEEAKQAMVLLGKYHKGLRDVQDEARAKIFEVLSTSEAFEQDVVDNVFHWRKSGLRPSDNMMDAILAKIKEKQDTNSLTKMNKLYHREPLWTSPRMMQAFLRANVAVKDNVASVWKMIGSAGIRSIPVAKEDFMAVLSYLKDAGEDSKIEKICKAFQNPNVPVAATYRSEVASFAKLATPNKDAVLASQV
eukprot:CAMPEP_0184698614 /NCGR_PEP_ID=MMETSP0313-20130426/5174_1 /TAXON_ID=2792 /ORGANISM="Porphyridium aerugineum, Strain SAG 1380-2" /LENGTH=277 /DNA_ID=CAMNT_0027157579 /DNA_START=90 /DNA_END=923 /DNA_ORIENTATION=-